MEQEKVWDAIAKKWAEFRVEPLSEVEEFLDKKMGKVLDLGCGSGRNFLGSEDLKFYGVDFSGELLKIAKGKNYAELKKGMTYDIPYEDEFFDFVVFVRVLHCVDSAERRGKTLEEVYRVLKNGGEALISVWGRGQERMKTDKEKEGFVPWSVGDEKVERYTYLYDVEELRKELEDVGFEIMEIETGDNIVVVVRKG